MRSEERSWSLTDEFDVVLAHTDQTLPLDQCYVLKIIKAGSDSVFAQSVLDGTHYHIPYEDIRAFGFEQSIK